MDIIQNEFIKILSDSLKEQKPSIYTDIKWVQVLELIEKYKVEGIVYKNIINNDLTAVVSEEAVNRLKCRANQIEEEQKRNIEKLNNVVKEFNRKEIQFILLGSLATKELYNYSEMREVNSIDILIQEDDFENTKTLLNNLKYKILEENTYDYKVTFIDNNEDKLVIYYHLCSKDDENKELIMYERTVWKRAVKLNLEKSEILVLNYEDLALRLCINIAHNISNGTNDFKELCDLAMLTERKRDSVNWDSFLMKSGMYGSEKVSLIIFILCEKLFNVEIPKDFEIGKLNNKKYIDALINEIFNDSFNKEFIESQEEIVAMLYSKQETDEKKNIIVNYIMKIVNKINKKIKEFNTPITREKLLKWMEL